MSDMSFALWQNLLPAGREYGVIDIGWSPPLLADIASWDFDDIPVVSCWQLLTGFARRLAQFWGQRVETDHLLATELLVFWVKNEPHLIDPPVGKWDEPSLFDLNFLVAPKGCRAGATSCT